MARAGLTIPEMAREFKVAVSTVNKWRRDYPEFAEAMDDGRDLADARVEDALYQSAISGNVTACIFWLKNRRPAKWRDVQRTEHTGADGGQIEHLTSDQLDREIERLERELAKNDRPA